MPCIAFQRKPAWGWAEIRSSRARVSCAAFWGGALLPACEGVKPIQHGGLHRRAPLAAYLRPPAVLVPSVRERVVGDALFPGRLFAIQRGEERLHAASECPGFRRAPWRGLPEGTGGGPTAQEQVRVGIATGDQIDARPGRLVGCQSFGPAQVLHGARHPRRRVAVHLFRGAADPAKPLPRLLVHPRCLVRFVKRPDLARRGSESRVELAQHTVGIEPDVPQEPAGHVEHRAHVRPVGIELAVEGAHAHPVDRLQVAGEQVWEDARRQRPQTIVIVLADVITLLLPGADEVIIHLAIGGVEILRRILREVDEDVGLHPLDPEGRQLDARVGKAADELLRVPGAHATGNGIDEGVPAVGVDLTPAVEGPLHILRRAEVTLAPRVVVVDPEGIGVALWMGVQIGVHLRDGDAHRPGCQCRVARVARHLSRDGACH